MSAAARQAGGPDAETGERYCAEALLHEKQHADPGHAMPEVKMKVQQHYARENIVEKAMKAVQAAGKDPDRLTVDDLAMLDQMHLRGIKATREIARRAKLRKGMRVLDVGSGLGGPARVMAADLGCEVVGVDLTPEFVAAAKDITKRLDLTNLVGFQEADAANLPFDDHTFDAATSMTAFMNMPDKAAVYEEVHRVLKPGGRLVQIETLQGPKGEPYYPTLWARDASYSFLISPKEARAIIENAGFKVLAFDNDDQASLEWASKMQEKMKAEGPGGVGPHVIHGPEILENMSNTIRSIAEGRATVAVIEAESSK
jgi:MPBQ/MSBQ methyltransferase